VIVVVIVVVFAFCFFAAGCVATKLSDSKGLLWDATVDALGVAGFAFSG